MFSVVLLHFSPSTFIFVYNVSWDSYPVHLPAKPQRLNCHTMDKMFFTILTVCHEIWITLLCYVTLTWISLSQNPLRLVIVQAQSQKTITTAKMARLLWKKKWQMKWLEKFSWMPIHTERGVMKCKLCCKWPNMVLLSFFLNLVWQLGFAKVQSPLLILTTVNW